MVDEQRLTLGEGTAIERHFRVDLADAGSMVSLVGVLYVSLRRAGIKVSWDAVEAITSAELEQILITEPGDEDEGEEDPGQAPDPPAPGPEETPGS
jgi:hypothetical protein